jgi:hypothetical protein
MAWTDQVVRQARQARGRLGRRAPSAVGVAGRQIEGGRIEEVVAEQPQQVKRLLSEAQQALVDEWLLPLDEVQLLGPVRAAKWGPATGQLGDIAAELWEAGDRLRFLELSVLAKDDPLGHQQRLDEMVRSHYLEVDPEADTKTRRVSAAGAGCERPAATVDRRFGAYAR